MQKLRRTQCKSRYASGDAAASAIARSRSTIGASRDPPAAAAVYDAPASHARPIAGSSGTRPRKGAPKAAAIASAPPRAAGNGSAYAERFRSSGHFSRRSASADSVTSAAADESNKSAIRNFIKTCQSRGVGAMELCALHLKREGALLEELFTHDGSGTLIAQNPYEQARSADINDIASIVEVIRPLEDSGALVKRSRERLEEEIGYFSILERDGRVLACAALYPYEAESVGEIACVATHPDYRGTGRARQLLDELLAEAKALSLTHVFVLTTQSTHWFLEQGFEAASLDDLPVEKQLLYNLSLIHISEPTRLLSIS